MDNEPLATARKHFIMGLRACGPCSREWLEYELITQTPGVTESNVTTIVDTLINCLIKDGDLEQYDDIKDAYILTDKYYQDLRSRGEE